MQVEPQPDGRLVAVKVNGSYWMYWGENDIHVATSDDLYNWVPLMSDDPTHEYRGRPDHQDLPTGATKPLSVLRPRRGKFDSNLVEPGPPAILRDDGILFIYNSKNVVCDKEENSVCVNGESDPDLAPGTYSAGQALFSRTDPTKLLKRSDENFFKPTEDFEITGQVGNVCFLEGMVFFKDKWLLYYGTADSKIAVAESSDFDYTGKKDPRKRGSSSKKPMFQPVRDNFSPDEISNRAYNTLKKKSSASTEKKATTPVSKKESVPAPDIKITAPDVTNEAAVPREDSTASLHPAEVTDVTSADITASATTTSTSTLDVPVGAVSEKTVVSEKKVKPDDKASSEDSNNLRSENSDENKKKKAKSTKKKSTSSAKPTGDEDKFML